MTPASVRKRSVVYVLLIMIGIGATSGRVPAATSATSALPAMSRYTSATYGYALPLPSGWTRVPNVRWLPTGPAADLTVMTPDHKAMLGVLVAPTGPRVPSDADLQRVAHRLIMQEDRVASGKIYERRAIINGAPYRMALATLDHGGEIQATSWMLVLTTARRHRLYAFAGLVYDREIHYPVHLGPGNGQTPPTPTDTLIVLPFPVAPSMRGPAAPGATPRAAPWTGVPRPASRPARSARMPPAVSTAPAGARSLARAPAGARDVRPHPATIAGTMEPAGTAPCPEARDIFPPVVDKNCALRAEQATIERSFAGIIIDPRAADDPRPAPLVGLDAFTRQRDATAGYTIDYPAQWTRWSTPDADFAIRPPDHKAFVAVVIRPTGGASYARAALQTVDDHQLAQLGKVVAPIAHTAQQIGRLSWVVAQPNGILLDVQRTDASSNGVVATTTYRGRIYLLVAWVYQTGPGADDQDRRPAFFAPYFPLARVAGLDYADTWQWAAQLARECLDSFAVDPRVPVDRRPAPAVGVDGFARHASAAHGYSISYPAQWTPTPGAGRGVDVGTGDGSVRLGVVVRPATGADADPRAVADRAMAPYLKGGAINHPSTYTTIRLNGQTWLVAHNDRAETEVFDNQGIGHYVDRDVTILVAVKNGRLYVAAAWVRQDNTFTTQQNIDLVRSSLDTLALT